MQFNNLIGVARIFSAGVHFFLKKLMTFLAVVLNTLAKTANLTTPTFQTSLVRQNLLKILLAVSERGGALTIYPDKLRRKKLSPQGVHLHTVHLLATPMNNLLKLRLTHPLIPNFSRIRQSATELSYGFIHAFSGWSGLHQLREGHSRIVAWAQITGGTRGTSPPEFGVGDVNANCPPQIFVIYMQVYKKSVLWPSIYDKICFRPGPGLSPDPQSAGEGTFGTDPTSALAIQMWQVCGPQLRWNKFWSFFL